MRRNWIKLYVDQVLRGTCFKELIPDERFIWFGFLLLAGDNAMEGKICVTEEMGFSNKQLASLLKCKTELITRSIKKMVRYEKIKICESNIIQILNWKKYQSEYQRQRDYREEYKKRKQKINKSVVTTRSNSKCGIERDRERDIEEERDKDNNKISLSKLKKIFDENSIEYKLSLHLFKKIKKNNPDAKQPNFQLWSKHMDYMIRIDKRNPDTIKEIIDWCQKDSFWHTNILSARKLREQYDQLLLKSGKAKKQHVNWEKFIGGKNAK